MHIMRIGGNLLKGAEVCTSFSQWYALAVDRCDVARLTVDMLPDVALLTIFDFYLEKKVGYELYKKEIESWRTLVHVCRKWRNVVFGSPRRLNLRLRCSAGTLERGRLDVWPLLSIVVLNDDHEKRGVRYIIAALKHNDRVYGIKLCWYDLSWGSSRGSKMESVLAAMRQPFPALTNLIVQAEGRVAPAVPPSFLGGSAPCLQSLVLRRIPFLALPKLLLSATRLVDLELLDIPESGYLSPEAVVTSLSRLTRLERFRISFESPEPHPDQKSRRPIPQTSTLLPTLTGLWFGGVHAYLEDLVAQIDAPLLNELYLAFSTFDTPQLTPFISHIPKFKAHNKARVFLFGEEVLIKLPRAFDGALELEVSCEEPERQLSWMARLCSSSLPPPLIPTLEYLYLISGELPYWADVEFELEDSLWLELLRPFTSVKYLYISYEFEHDLAPVLQGLVGEKVTEVLPALQTLFVQDFSKKGRFKEVIGSFVAARQLSGHPITVSHWDEE